MTFLHLDSLGEVVEEAHESKAPVNLPTGRRPVSFRARSARVHAHRPQAGLLSGAKQELAAKRA